MIEKLAKGLSTVKTQVSSQIPEITAKSAEANSSALCAFLRRFWEIRLFRFFVIGAVNTLFSYLIYAGAILIGMHYTLATLISTVLGIIFNFFTTGKVVFRSLEGRRFFLFMLVYAVTYVVNILLLRLLVDVIHINKLIAGALVTLPVALLSYYLNARWTFRGVDSRSNLIYEETGNDANA
ncbi:MAG: GtrA family protein [Anaerolineaceae bacterium]|jgi:putative flippase GtrA|nr:GtrA family protein [Anaerolineaceae bacterium]MDI9531068.1 GtrA family protein [Chloroflexota bacterium]HOF28238.1 GtrA family protein [Anaerolineaceae bacterium]